MFHPVPWAIGLYGLFTIIRLFCAYRNFLPQYLLYASIIMDMGILMFLIWSFHIQYQQPASFYLKAPTVMYVFIFIAIRSLRFEPRYILSTGAAAIIGWVGMVLYVIFADSSDVMITRNYVEYLTSNAVLIGAEVDKIISMAVVTVVLAIAAFRAQRNLDMATLDHMATKDLARFVPREVAAKITFADKTMQAGDGEARYGSIIFADIEGFSTISEKLTPQQLVSLLNNYFEAMSKAIAQYGGVITQFQGDMILITFNAINNDISHSKNAVLTALAIQKTANETIYNDGIKLLTRCGVNSGEIIVGVVGSNEHLNFTVHGDQVNVAARLEVLNKEYGSYILVGENTVNDCANDFNFKKVGEVAVRGRVATTKIYNIIS